MADGMCAAGCSPYRYGYITELRASKGFRYDNVKHYSMGRMAHEMGCAPLPTPTSDWAPQPWPLRSLTCRTLCPCNGCAAPSTGQSNSRVMHLQCLMHDMTLFAD
jgi:hypothetical protein